MAVLLAVVLCSGCGTISARKEAEGRPYYGLGHDLEKVSTGEEWVNFSAFGNAGGWPIPIPQGLLWLIDVPLSLTADTLLLPIDALRSKPAEANSESSTAKLREGN